MGFTGQWCHSEQLQHLLSLCSPLVLSGLLSIISYCISEFHGLGAGCWLNWGQELGDENG